MIEAERITQQGRPVAVATAGALGGLAVLHGVWAFSPWPLESRARYAEVLVGVAEEKLPSAKATLGVAGLLSAATSLVLMRADVVPRVGPEWLPRWGVRVLAAILLLRGVAGLVVSGFGRGNAPEAFRRLDLRVYSPLCLALAAGATTTALLPDEASS